MLDKSPSPKSLLENFFDSEPAIELLPWLSVKDISRLKRSSHGLNNCFLFSEPLLQDKLNQLALHIFTKPNEVEVKKILDKNPELVLEKIKQVKDSVRTIKHVTPLQLAYGTSNPALCALLASYINKVCGNEKAGKKEISAQLEEKFDNQEIINEALFPDLTKIIQAIENERFNVLNSDGRFILNNETLKTIAEFRSKFTASQAVIIDKGMYFRAKTLLEIGKEYAKIVAQRWSDNPDSFYRCKLFEDGVMSFLLRYVSAFDAMQFSQGLYFLQEERKELTSTLDTRDGYHFYDTLYSDSAYFVLTGHCVDIVFGLKGNREITQWWPAGWHNNDPFHQRNWYEKKIEDLDSFTNEQSIQNRLSM